MTKADLDSTAVRLFTDRGQAHRAVQKLTESGFRHDQIRIAPFQPSADEGEDRTPGTHAAAGGLIGMFIGGLLGGLLGVVCWVGLIPALAAALLGRSIATLCMLTLLGAAVSGFAGVLVGWSFRCSMSNHYADQLERGGILVSVDARGQHVAATAILDSYGGTKDWRVSEVALAAV